ncbi:MAG: helix-turn-helix domain-containing protein [Desulfovibrio sp.]|jgi:transcriptional regulator with XRE-family HTH domain|nr:helix-turn-helix domain-containing protein [Desulfovibrio sp.]
MSSSDFSERLRQLAAALNVEHQELARAGRVSKATFSNYVHGEKFPRMETIANWIENYGVNANWLICGVGEMFIAGKAQAMGRAALMGKDPVLDRLNAAVIHLQSVNAPDEVIQTAVLAVLNSTKASPPA